MHDPSATSTEGHKLVADLLELITSTFPDIKWTSYKYLDEGWDHQVIILDNKLVFRFPSDREYKEKLQTEIEILAYLAGQTKIDIPEYTYVSPKKDFAGYPKIPGLQLYKEHFDSLREHDQDRIADQLASFLSTIHTQDITQSLFKKVSKSYLAADQEEVKVQIDKNLKKYISKHDLSLVNEIMQQVDSLIGRQLPRVFVHNDIYDRHLLWDKDKGHLGLIDFSDMSIDDPAIDFGDLHEYGKEFVKKVYENYTGPKDPTFLERAWIYQKWIAVYMMTDHFENHKTTFEEARKTFDRVRQQAVSI